MIPVTKNIGRRTGAALLVGTILGGWSAPLLAQATTAPQTPPATAPQAPEAAAPVRTGVIRSLSIRGNERLEPETVRAYANLTPGQEYTPETLDTALKDLYATELFADVVITGADTGDLVISVRENPVINRIVLEGNKAIKSDKILPEIKLAPRQIFTRTKARADVERIVELYRRQGRFGAQVEPKVVQLEQNRVDLVFEIAEGPKSKVRAINIIGNQEFSDGRLRKEMFTRQAGGILGFMKSNDSYDPDRLAADQQKLRAFYLTQGYADFRVVSALAELTPDRRDFVITYVVEEGPRYKFGKIEAESALRDLTREKVLNAVKLEQGDWFDAKAVEDTVTVLTEIAGTYGYAFAAIDPSYARDAENRVMNVTFKVADTPRVYVERIEIQGNTLTRDKVIRREFRLNEGDAFNAVKVRRSQDRLQSLGFFQDKLEVKQTEGSTPDRVVLGVDVEERATGQLELSGGYSSLERIVLQLAIAQRNFMGKGQQLNASLNYSQYSKAASIGFLEPYLFDKTVSLGGEIYRRDYNSFNYVGNERNRTYSQVSTGLGLRTGFPVTEFVTFGTRYSLVADKITLDEDTFFQDGECSPTLAGRYLCDELGTRITSLLGYSGVFDNTNGIRATRGHRLVLSQDFAGLGGDVKYIRTRVDGTKFWQVFSGWVLSAHAEGGFIKALQNKTSEGVDDIRISDRFFGPQLRGFDIRGIGPRVLRTPYLSATELDDESSQTSDSLGGKAYYMGRLELEIPVSSGLRSLGLRPSAFVDAGSVWSLTKPLLINTPGVCVEPTDNNPATVEDSVVLEPGETCPTGFNYVGNSGIKEEFVGNSAKPRLSVGVGVNWVSPFGPFRIDIAKALLKQRGDDTKFFSFNVGTQF